ncbi:MULTISPECIES: LLM class flavin-dependent oxidoreductase [Geobacillus]|jgi:alkanesulfonate monooxygenase|uniref:LLM class flavin-dependent oxidoreductase n=1 Tax=Geobacillus TaxID=129337 RepID=UPI00017E6F2D|nr:MULTISPECIES: LLM class flavin-dependent oxidoreductase [Geobacillus]MED4917485.1 LLM class flavin-dependent oxidoreductase [Geobacillus thermodenitrificans]NNU87900.1 LLM class flavin-dependent oxidoreductase [Geobacillus sp. MR]
MVEFITMAPTSGDSTFVGLANNSTNINSWTGTGEDPERPPTAAYIEAIAKAAEAHGFATLLLPTGAGCLDSLAVAAYLAARTTTLRFLFAARPGGTSPAIFAKQLATVHNWSNGRAFPNIVTGGSPIELAAEGDFLDHDTRYERTREYIHLLKQLFTLPSVTYEGRFYRLENASLFPKPAKRPPIYFGGASDIAKEVAAKEADVYMMWGETFERTKERIEEMKQKATQYGRTLRYSVSFQVVLGETEKEAWERADALVSHLSESVKRKKDELIQKGDSVGAKRLHELMTTSAKQRFQIGPNLWAGLTQVLSGNSIALVGTPEQVADRLIEFIGLGFDYVLLRGFPHLETIEQVGSSVIPLVRERLRQTEVWV